LPSVIPVSSSVIPAKAGIHSENSDLIEIKNPLSEKLEVMRISLIPYLLENSQKNILNFKNF